MEWLLLLPKLGFLPQITHILDMWLLVLRRIAQARESAIVCRRSIRSDKGPQRRRLRPASGRVEYDTSVERDRGRGEMAIFTKDMSIMEALQADPRAR
jgi:hypothetical protein